MSFLELDDEIKELFLDKIKTTLIQGKTIQTVKRKRSVKVRYYKIDDTYVAVGKDVTNSEESNTTLDSAPQFILEFVANSLSTEAAIKYLENQGYEVIDPALADEDKKQSQGLSDRAISEIRAKLLGLDDVMIDSSEES